MLLIFPLFLMLAVSQMRNAYAFSGTELPFWGPSLILAALLAGAGCICLVRQRAVTFFTLLAVFFVSGVSFFPIAVFMEDLNYAFDTEEAVHEEVLICDKEIRTHRREADSYHFEVRTEKDEFWVQVDKDDYFCYKSGDRYLLLRYRGAFSVPFYLAE